MSKVLCPLRPGRLDVRHPLPTPDLTTHRYFKPGKYSKLLLVHLEVVAPSTSDTRGLMGCLPTSPTAIPQLLVLQMLGIVTFLDISNWSPKPMPSSSLSIKDSIRRLMSDASAGKRKVMRTSEINSWCVIFFLIFLDSAKEKQIFDLRMLKIETPKKKHGMKFA